MTGDGTLLPDAAALQEMECDLLLGPFALHATMAVQIRRQDFCYRNRQSVAGLAELE